MSSLFIYLFILFKTIYYHNLSFEKIKMDVNSETSPKSPLLGSGGRRPSDNGRLTRRLSRRYSVNSLRTEFVARLPDKVRSGLDVESSPYDIDLSATKGLSSGLLEKLCLVTEKMSNEESENEKCLFIFILKKLI